MGRLLHLAVTGGAAAIMAGRVAGLAPMPQRAALVARHGGAQYYRSQTPRRCAAAGADEYVITSPPATPPLLHADDENDDHEALPTYDPYHHSRARNNVLATGRNTRSRWPPASDGVRSTADVADTAIAAEVGSPWSQHAATIVLRDVSKRFGRSNLFFPSERASALRDVRLQLQAAGIVALVGDSGSGKSTLLKVINGCETTTAGSVEVDGVRERVYMTRGFSVPHLGRSVGHNMQFLAMAGVKTAAGSSDAAGRQQRQVNVEAATEAILRLTDLAARAETPARDLSGSEVLQLGLALALARGVWAPDPPVLLLDEYLDQEDARLRRRVEGTLKRLARSASITILSSTHVMEHAMGCADAVVVMSGGKVVQADPPKDTAYIRTQFEKRGVAYRDSVRRGEMVDRALDRALHLGRGGGGDNKSSL